MAKNMLMYIQNYLQIYKAIASFKQILEGKLYSKLFHYANIHKNNLAIVNRSCISCVHNMLRASIVTPVTLKSRLRVTQGHWKWNHHIDRTQLTIS